MRRPCGLHLIQTTHPGHCMTGPKMAPTLENTSLDEKLIRPLGGRSGAGFHSFTPSSGRSLPSSHRVLLSFHALSPPFLCALDIYGHWFFCENPNTRPLSLALPFRHMSSSLGIPALSSEHAPLSLCHMWSWWILPPRFCPSEQVKLTMNTCSHTASLWQALKRGSITEYYKQQ